MYDEHHNLFTNTITSAYNATVTSSTIYLHLFVTYKKNCHFLFFRKCEPKCIDRNIFIGVMKESRCRSEYEPIERRNSASFKISPRENKIKNSAESRGIEAEDSKKFTSKKRTLVEILKLYSPWQKNPRVLLSKRTLRRASFIEHGLFSRVKREAGEGRIVQEIRNAFHEFFIGHASRIPTTVHAVISTGNFHGPTDIILIVIFVVDVTIGTARKLETSWPLRARETCTKSALYSI